jgi:hypothetical protein
MSYFGRYYLDGGRGAFKTISTVVKPWRATKNRKGRCGPTRDESTSWGEGHDGQTACDPRFLGFCRVGSVGDGELLRHELMVEMFNTGARRNNRSLRVAITGVVALLISLTPAPALTVDVYSSPELRQLLDGKFDPLPAVPLAFPQFDKRKEVDDLLKGQIPAVFQVSQATGEYADPAKVDFFQIVGAHYFLRVGFVKIAANSEAALALYDRPVTKPVYIIFDPTKVGPLRFKVWDESEVGDMDQNEDAIKEKITIRSTSSRLTSSRRRS